MPPLHCGNSILIVSSFTQLSLPNLVTFGSQKNQDDNNHNNSPPLQGTALLADVQTVFRVPPEYGMFVSVPLPGRIMCPTVKLAQVLWPQKDTWSWSLEVTMAHVYGHSSITGITAQPAVSLDYTLWPTVLFTTPKQILFWILSWIPIFPSFLLQSKLLSQSRPTPLYW